MRFLDANVFIYAYYKPKYKLSEKRRKIKEHAKEIVRRINEGEDVMTTIFHISEVSNILKRALSIEDLYSLLVGLLSLDNIKIIDVTKEDYLGAVELMKELKVDPNDCLAVEVMKREGLTEIYTFDKGFDNVDGIRRIPREIDP